MFGTALLTLYINSFLGQDYGPLVLRPGGLHVEPFAAQAPSRHWYTNLIEPKTSKSQMHIVAVVKFRLAIEGRMPLTQGMYVLYVGENLGV